MFDNYGNRRSQSFDHTYCSELRSSSRSKKKYLNICSNAFSHRKSVSTLDNTCERVANGFEGNDPGNKNKGNNKNAENMFCENINSKNNKIRNKTECDFSSEEMQIDYDNLLQRLKKSLKNEKIIDFHCNFDNLDHKKLENKNIIVNFNVNIFTEKSEESKEKCSFSTKKCDEFAKENSEQNGTHEESYWEKHFREFEEKLNQVKMGSFGCPKNYRKNNNFNVSRNNWNLRSSSVYEEKENVCFGQNAQTNCNLKRIDAENIQKENQRNF